MHLKKLFTINLWAWAVFATLTMAMGCSDDCATVSCTDTSAMKKRPNFITLVLDDVGFSDLGYQGGEIPTPNIDKLAKEGIVFTNFYGASTSAPSRAMLFTGKDNHQVGVGTQCAFKHPDTLGAPGYECTLEFYTPCFAELLVDEGYHTMFTGKWHMGITPNRIPDARGFNETRGVILEGQDMYFAADDGTPIPAFPPLRYQRAQRNSFWNENGQEVTRFPTDFYSTDYMTDSAIGMLKDRPKDKPFYLNISYNAAHWPLQAPEEVTEKYIAAYSQGWDVIREQRFEKLKALGYLPEDDVLPVQEDVPRWDSLNIYEQQIQAKKMAVYAAIIDIMDQNVGKLVDYLKEIGEYENTVIFLCADNGASDRDPDTDPAFGMVDWIAANFDNSLASIGSKHSFTGYGKGWAMASNTPFNKAKATHYEGGIHTAAFVHYPKAKLTGIRYDCITSIKDIAPTILEMAGIVFPRTYMGNFITPMQGVSLAGLIEGDLFGCDAERYLGFEFYGIKGLRQGEWKISQEVGVDEFHFFNLADDLYENHDLRDELPGEFERMLELYEYYSEENGVINIPNSGGGGKKKKDFIFLDD